MYTASQKETIQKLYKNTYNTVTVATKTGLSQSGIERYLKRSGLYRKELFRRSVSIEQEKEIVNLYLDKNLSSVAISKLYNVCDNTILKVLNNNGVNTSNTEKYSLVKNLHAFENIDSELKAWLLGFIIADGNVTVPKNKLNSKVFQLEIQERDIEVLKHLCSAIEAPEELIHRYNRVNTNSQPTIKISFYSNTFCNHLSKWGVVPRKTHIVQFPKVSLDLERHVIRGLIDGDGAITNTTIALFGNKHMCDTIHNKWIEIGVLEDSIKRYVTTCFSVRVFKKEEREKILKYLYKDATYYLSRKAIYSP